MVVMSVEADLAGGVLTSGTALSFAPGLPLISTGPFDEAFAATLAHLLDHGDDVRGGDSQSVGHGKFTKELLNFTLYLSRPTDRLLANPQRPLNIIGAVGRFVWMMAGSDRLADIAYYEPRVSGFSDDGLTVPGSCYGARLLNPRPGVDQVRSAIEILRSDPTSRRAAAAIYEPEDAGRESRDIPCAFGMFWTIRSAALVTTAIMRSNNAWTLLPYNVFEFTLLSEVIAAELNLELGSYSHFAFSMHLYEADFASARAALGQVRDEALTPMRAIPRGSALADLHRLLLFEQEVRSGGPGINTRNCAKWQRDAMALGPFWSDFGLILLTHAVRQADRDKLVARVAGEVTGPLGDLLREQLGLAERQLVIDLSSPDLADARTGEELPASEDEDRSALEQETRKFWLDRSRQELDDAVERTGGTPRRR